MFGMIGVSCAVNAVAVEAAALASGLVFEKRLVAPVARPLTCAELNRTAQRVVALQNQERARQFAVGRELAEREAMLAEMDFQ